MCILHHKTRQHRLTFSVLFPVIQGGFEASIADTSTHVSWFDQLSALSKARTSSNSVEAMAHHGTDCPTRHTCVRALCAGIHCHGCYDATQTLPRMTTVLELVYQRSISSLKATRVLMVGVGSIWGRRCHMLLGHVMSGRCMLATLCSRLLTQCQRTPRTWTNLLATSVICIAQIRMNGCISVAILAQTTDHSQCVFYVPSVHLRALPNGIQNR